MIKRRKTYANDTEQVQTYASKRRDISVDDNLVRFAQMASGDPAGLGWCVQAKIGVDDSNKTLRNPVIYHADLLLHHQTGDTWEVYPKHDFACPIMDSMEDATHALMTNGYRDRNPQSQWIFDALGFRYIYGTTGVI